MILMTISTGFKASLSFFFTVAILGLELYNGRSCFPCVPMCVCVHASVCPLCLFVSFFHMLIDFYFVRLLYFPQ